MKYLTEKEFEKEMTQIKQQKRQYEMRKELREAKRRFPKFKKPRTSKMVLWTEKYFSELLFLLVRSHQQR